MIESVFPERRSKIHEVITLSKLIRKFGACTNGILSGATLPRVEREDFLFLGIGIGDTV